MSDGTPRTAEVTFSLEATPRGRLLREGPAAPPPAPLRAPARVARMLAFARWLVSAIDRGLYAALADAARDLGLTRARVSQLVDLTLLAPDIQEAVLALEHAAGPQRITEHALRTVVAAIAWPEQRRRWDALRRNP
jgi:hypothetical protein